MTRTTKEILTEANQISTPEAGARLPQGKADDENDALRRGKLPASSAVTEAKVEPGVAAKCIKAQVANDGDPKRRSDNFWGVGKKSTEDEKEFK